MHEGGALAGALAAHQPEEAVDQGGGIGRGHPGNMVRPPNGFKNQTILESAGCPGRQEAPDLREAPDRGAPWGLLTYTASVVLSAAVP